MGLAVRIIPTILCRGRTQVKGERFNAWRTVGLAEQAVRTHQGRGVDELVLLDIGATPDGRGPDLKLVEELTADCFMPLAVGGGVRTLQHVKDLLRAGADKVVIGTGQFEVLGAGPDRHNTERTWLVSDVAAAVGSQAITVSIDVKAGTVWKRGGTVDKGWLPHDFAKLMEARGAGEILLTSIEREGTMQGYDLETIAAVSRAVDIPVVAHGGCGTYQHMLEAIQAGASAVAAGAMFQFTDATPRGAAEYLREHGIEVRLEEQDGMHRRTG